jgi:F-type H+-transporting ATPase subunit b
VTRSLVLALLPLLAVAARAAEEGEHAEGHSGWDFFWEYFNLALLIGVLVYLTRKPVLAFLRERRQRIETNLAASERLAREAEARLAEWTKRGEGLDAELEQIRSSARQRAEQERERILAAARASAERTLREAELAVESEIARARSSLKREAAELAVELAAGRLRSEVNDGDRERLVEDFIARLENPERAAGVGSQAGAAGRAGPGGR